MTATNMCSNFGGFRYSPASFMTTIGSLLGSRFYDYDTAVYWAAGFMTTIRQSTGQQVL